MTDHDRIATLERELAAVRAENQANEENFANLLASIFGDGGHRQGDGGDHPETLTCPVLMRPDDVRGFVAASVERDALRGQVARMQAALEPLEAICDCYRESEPDGRVVAVLLGHCRAAREALGAMRGG